MLKGEEVSKMFVIILNYFLIFLCSTDLIAFRPAFFLSAFNIDEEFPIVISNKFDGSNAHFGATVLLLPAEKGASGAPVKDNGITGWAIIGAPKANSTSPNHKGIFEPGVIWRCSLGNMLKKDGTPRQDVCRVVEIDPTGDFDPKDRGQPRKDKKDGGWLGGSMAVNADKFVACASRWINQKYPSAYFLNGICYWIPRASLLAETLVLPLKQSYRLSPLLNVSHQYYTEETREVGQKGTVLFDWAYGQFGFSLHITPNNEIVSGAVGVLDWIGSIVKYRDSSVARPQFARYNAHPASSVASEVVVVRAQNHTRNHTQLLRSSDYFGYSVTSGNFFKREISHNKTQFVGGAPRASQLSGRVFVFTIEELEHGRSEGKIELLTEPIEGADRWKGNHYGSYFGSVLLALNVNGDEFDDLIVGAPLFGTSLRIKRNALVHTPAPSNSTEEGDEDTGTTKMRSGDEGCVFVYLSNGTDFNLSDVQELCGDKVSGARFGSAITSLGDINDDTFNDIAVGAPYENEGRGAVYIYHGGKHYLMLAQKLQPQTIDPKIRTFGWSLSFGADIDGNGYPDLAVGSYETNQVVIYRTIPIVHFKTTLTASIPKLLATTEDFNLTTCLSYTGKGIRSTLAIWVKLTVEVEPEGKRLISLVQNEVGSVRMDDNHTPAFLRSLLLSRRKLFYFPSEGSCFNFTALKTGNVDGLTRIVQIRQDYWIDGYDRDIEAVKPIIYEIQKDSINNDSIVNISSSEFDNFKQAKLPMPKDNMFGTTKLNLSVGTICESDGNPECLANLTIDAWLTGQSAGVGLRYSVENPFLLGTANILKLEVEISNSREIANLPIILDLRWLSPPSVRRQPSDCRDLTITSQEEHYLCSIRKAIIKSKSDRVFVELDMTSVYGQREDRTVEFKMRANSSSLLVHQPKFRLRVPLKTQMKLHNFNHEASKTEYKRNASVPSFGITQAFEIGLDGPSTAAALLIKFDIPTKILFQHELLELISVNQSIVTYDGVMDCQNEGPRPASEQTPEEGDANGGKMRRVTRSVADWFSRTFNSAEMYGIEELVSGSTLKLNCDSDLVTCHRISCTAKHFTPAKKAVVEFKLRILTNVADLLLDPHHHDEEISTMWIETGGSVRTLDTNGKPFGEAGKLYFKSRLAIPPLYDEIPAWILIVAVAGGLLLLTICTIILKKCGFFRRSKRDQLRQRMEMEKHFGQKRRLPSLRKPVSPPTSNTNTSSTVRARTPSSLSSQHNSIKKPSLKVVLPNSRGSLMGIECNSPGTIAKLRQGAVDLTELRRLYATMDQNELYD